MHVGVGARHLATAAPRTGVAHGQLRSFPQVVKQSKTSHKLRCQSSERDDGNAGEWTAGAAADRLFRDTQHLGRQQIGSEYGEGFIQFPLSGSVTQLDVDTLNERLKANGALRMRHAMCPDEAYGMVFAWDNVIADTRSMQRRAWQRLAEEEDLHFPTVERQLYDIRPERVITEVLQWTQDWKRAQELSFRVAALFIEEVEQLTETLPGVRTWLTALHSAKIPCALVSQLPTGLLKSALERMGIAEYFPVRVTAEDDTETLAQRLLSAAFKMQRPPNMCVAFESSPSSVAAAHNCTMKAVAVQGAHKGYQLQQADLTCSSMSELTVYNVRRLFAMRGAEFMDKNTANIGAPPVRRRIANGTI